MCHVSRVKCQNILFNLFYLKKEKEKRRAKIFLKKMDKVVELVSRGSVINGAYPVRLSDIEIGERSQIKKNILVFCLYWLGWVDDGVDQTF